MLKERGGGRDRVVLRRVCLKTGWRGYEHVPPGLRIGGVTGDPEGLISDED